LVGRDHATGARGAVAEIRRDGKAALAADLHPGDAAVPSGDDLAGAELELEGLVAVPRRVELLAVAVGHADVVDLDEVAGLRFVTVANGEIFAQQIGGRGRIRDRDFGLHRADVSCARSWRCSPPSRG